MCAFDAIQSFIGKYQALLLGLVGVWIAYRQMVISKTQVVIADKQTAISKDQLKLDLYDRRYEVFIKTAEFINQVTRGHPNEDPAKLIGHANQFQEIIVKSGFIFGPEIRELLEKISNVESDLYIITHTINDYPLGSDEFKMKIQQRFDQLNWLRTTLKELEAKFSPYLSFSNLNSQVYNN